MAAIDRTITRLPLWGKLERTDADTGLSWHSLVDHSADVAACMEALLGLPTIQSRLATLAGRDKLPPIWLPRLAAHAFLHDLMCLAMRCRTSMCSGMTNAVIIPAAQTLTRLQRQQSPQPRVWFGSRHASRLQVVVSGCNEHIDGIALGLKAFGSYVTQCI